MYVWNDLRLIWICVNVCNIHIFFTQGVCQETLGSSIAERSSRKWWIWRLSGLFVRLPCKQRSEEPHHVTGNMLVNIHLPLHIYLICIHIYIYIYMQLIVIAYLCSDEDQNLQSSGCHFTGRKSRSCNSIARIRLKYLYVNSCGLNNDKPCPKSSYVGGMYTIPSHGWFIILFFPHYIDKSPNSCRI